MEEKAKILEYKCPNCDAPMVFGSETQKMTCEYCGSSFDVADVQAYNDSILEGSEDAFVWEDGTVAEWDSEEKNAVQVFVCPACSGELLTDAQTTATFCPFCENPAVLPQRLSGGLRPDGLIPFKKSKKEAQEAFLKLCGTKKLLPKFFTQEQRIERITGIYAPLWLYDCTGKENARYTGTRVMTWSDSRYHYTKTDQYLLVRNGEADFEGIPMDGSSKLDNAIMESIEPFDASQMIPFDTAYLSGYFADKYDVEAEIGRERIRQRVEETMDAHLRNSCMGYGAVARTSVKTGVTHGRARYVLFPVWLLTTRYEGKLYTFAMNGQTGKMTGSFPVSRQRCAAWFWGVCGAVTAAVTLLQLLF